MGYVFAVIWGLLWGSFLNVCIHRIPRGESVVRPASRCPGCLAPIRPLDNIPVLSYLLRRGRCRDCGMAISGRYPLVELVAAVVSVALFHRVLSNLHPDETAWVLLSRYMAFFVFSAALVVVSFIDMDYLIIPNTITYPGMILAFLYSLLPGGVTPLESLGGAVIGAGGLLVVIHLYGRLRGMAGMGYGDVKLMGMIGAFLGPVPLAFVIFAAALQGMLAAGVLALLKRAGVRNLPLYDAAVLQEEFDDELEVDQEQQGERDGDGGDAGHGEAVAEEPSSVWRQAIPFGPFLALGAIEYLLVGEEVIRIYVTTIERLVYWVIGLP